jgi:hypothetical protein
MNDLDTVPIFCKIPHGYRIKTPERSWTGLQKACHSRIFPLPSRLIPFPKKDSQDVSAQTTLERPASTPLRIHAPIFIEGPAEMASYSQHPPQDHAFIKSFPFSFSTSPRHFKSSVSCAKWQIQLMKSFKMDSPPLLD